MRSTLFRAESLKGGELSNFFGDLSVDDVFRIVIVKKYFLDPFRFFIESTFGANHYGSIHQGIY